MAELEKKREVDEVEVVNAPKSRLGDLYHQLLRASWSGVIGAIAAIFLGANVVFALGFLALGGVANMQRGSFADAFFFSVQTMGTIGYGSMYPVSRAANLLVTLEAVASLIVTALATGLVFSKFSMPIARIEFTRQLTIFAMDGLPTLAFRLANQRGNFVVEGLVRVSILRSEKTAEGLAMYRMHDLKLSRDPRLAQGAGGRVRRHPGGHRRHLDADAHARHRWLDTDVRFGMRHADMLAELPGGKLRLDHARFHELVSAPL